MAISTDGDGCLSLPASVREEHGDRFHVVAADDRIVLLPVAENPLAAVREAAGELHDTTIEEIRADIEDAATKGSDSGE